MAFHASLSGQRAFGSNAIAREDARAVWIGPWLESLWQDTAYAGRNLRRNPGFAAVVMIVLGTVIGLHTTLAAVLSGVLLRPWPGIRDASRVVTIHFWDPARGPQPTGLSLADARTIAERATTLTGLATMTRRPTSASDRVRLQKRQRR